AWLTPSRFIYCYTCFNGNAFAGSGSAVGPTAPFTGGRSWYMKSHFQRSEGFDACSQCRASIGRLNASIVRPSSAGTFGKRAAMSPRTCAPAVYSNFTPSARPTLTTISQSSMASPGAGIEHVQRGDASAFDCLPEGGDVRFTHVVAGRAGDEPEDARAVHVRRVDGRHLELRVRRLRLVAVAPAHGDRARAGVAHQFF